VEETGTWTPIGSLTAGEHLHSADGRSVLVTAVRHFEQQAPVYDLTVDSVHDYFVGAGTASVLVHNCGPGSGFPPRKLPRTKAGEPAPDLAAAGSPHTQLGLNRKGVYPQAREFDAGGKPVRDIDFTDHGRPADHANPHQHRYEEPPTGGTRQRLGAEPLEYP
jgi:hypothetical protein